MFGAEIGVTVVGHTDPGYSIKGEVAMLERVRKWLALRSYRTSLLHLLVRRYGRERHYTPAQVLATIKAHRFNERYAAYACAMFCSKRTYNDFVSARLAPAEVAVAPLNEPGIPPWAGLAIHDWPEYQHVTAELHQSYPDTQHWSSGVDHSGHSGDHWGHGHDDSGGGGHSHGGGGHDGGGHDGGGHY